jgi:hypothetical protein
MPLSDRELFARVTDMRRIILGSLLALFVLLQIGCQTVVVNSNRLEGMAGIRLMRQDDPINGSNWAKDIYNGDWNHSN